MKPQAFLLVGILAAGTTACCPRPPVAVSTPKENTAEGVFTRLDSARRMAKANDFAGAFREFAWLLDNATHVDPSFSGVDTAYVIGEMGDLAHRYSPAREDLERRRTQLEAAIDANSSRGRDSLRRLFAINAALGEPQRNLGLVEHLGTGRESADLRWAAMSDLLDELEAARRYDLLATVDEQMQNDLAGRERHARIMMDDVVELAATYFEVLAATDRQDEAMRVAKRAMQFGDVAQIRVQLSERAKRAGANDLVVLLEHLVP